ncbi:MAG: exosortase/archaeosortase family protein [Candidatus Omnitrophota bacterium]
MTQMPASNNQNIKQNLLLYTALSILVFLELYLLPSLLAPQQYFKTVYFLFDAAPVLALIFLIFFAFFWILSHGKTEITLRKKPLYISGLIHLIIFLSSLLLILYFINTYSFEPLPESNILLKIALLFNKKADYFAMRFKIAFLLILTLCHGSLLLFLFRIQLKKVIKNYAIAAAATLMYMFSESLWRLKDHLWRTLCYGVGAANLCLLRLSGLKNSSLEFSESKSVITHDYFKVPVINTGTFSAQIDTPCSGLGGIVVFLLVFGIILLADWKKFNKKRAMVVALLGPFIMYVANIIRVFVLFLIGHFYSPEFAVGIFHSYAGIIFYPIIVIAIIAVFYRWMLKKI